MIMSDCAIYKCTSELYFFFYNVIQGYITIIIQVLCECVKCSEFIYYILYIKLKRIALYKKLSIINIIIYLLLYSYCRRWWMFGGGDTGYKTPIHLHFQTCSPAVIYYIILITYTVIVILINNIHCIK